MPVHTPSHPGEIIREEILAPHGLDVTRAAAIPGQTRTTLSRLLNERAASDMNTCSYQYDSAFVANFVKFCYNPSNQ